MGNRTLIPAFKCTVGDWRYYVCKMKFAEVARLVSVERSIDDADTRRVDALSEYLLSTPDRFMGALIVTAVADEATFTPLEFAERDGFFQGLDSHLGILSFDGNQVFVAVSGDDQVEAIKNAVKQDAKIRHDDVCVIVVPHHDTPEGRQRTEQLRSDVNRFALPTAEREALAVR